MENKETLPTSMRLTPTALTLATKLARLLGISRTAVFETAIRDLAERKGVTSGISNLEAQGEERKNEAV
jgi:biotin operon repressor